MSNYLESLIGFLKAKDSILQKAAVSNASLFFDNLLYELSDYITSRQTVGALIAAFAVYGTVRTVVWGDGDSGESPLTRLEWNANIYSLTENVSSMFCIMGRIKMSICRNIVHKIHFYPD